jgi:hypothetical protein
MKKTRGYNRNALTPQQCLDSGKIKNKQYIKILRYLAKGYTYSEATDHFGYTKNSMYNVVIACRAIAKGGIDRHRRFFLNKKARKVGGLNTLRDLVEIDLIESNNVITWFEQNLQNLYDILLQSRNIRDYTLARDAVHELYLIALNEKNTIKLSKERLQTVLVMIYRHYDRQKVCTYIRGKSRIRLKPMNDDDSTEVFVDDFDWVVVTDDNYQLVDDDIKIEDNDRNTYSGIKPIDLISDSNAIKDVFASARAEALERQRRLKEGPFDPKVKDTGIHYQYNKIAAA